MLVHDDAAGAESSRQEQPVDVAIVSAVAEVHFESPTLHRLWDEEVATGGYNQLSYCFFLQLSEQ